MTEEQQEFVYTKEWLREKLATDKLAEEKAAEERRAEEDRENLRTAWRQQTGAEPTKAELEQLLADKRQEDVRIAARHNEAVARQQFRRVF